MLHCCILYRELLIISAYFFSLFFSCSVRICFIIRQQILHTLQTDSQRRSIVQERRCCRLDHTAHAKGDKSRVDSDDSSVITLDPFHHGIGKSPQSHDHPQVIRCYSDVRDLPGYLCPVADSNTCIAADSAGESLMPSPIIMTFLPASFSFSTNRALSSGRTSE